MHALEETLHRVIKATVEDKASQGGGVEGDAKPQQQVNQVICMYVNCM